MYSLRRGKVLEFFPHAYHVEIMLCRCEDGMIPKTCNDNVEGVEKPLPWPTLLVM